MPRSRASRRSRFGSGSQELELRGSRFRARSHERRPKRRRSGKEKRRHRHRTPRSTTSSQRTEETVSRVSEVILKGMSGVVRQVKPRTEVSVGTISSGILNEFNPLTGNVND
jgi:hypothetical protein